MRCPHPAPDHGPLAGYPSSSQLLGSLWRILWNLICESPDGLPLHEVVRQGVTEYRMQHREPVPEVTAMNLVVGAAAAGALDRIDVRVPGRSRPEILYRLPAALTRKG